MAMPTLRINLNAMGTKSNGSERNRIGPWGHIITHSTCHGSLDDDDDDDGDDDDDDGDGDGDDDDDDEDDNNDDDGDCGDEDVR